MSHSRKSPKAGKIGLNRSPLYVTLEGSARLEPNLVLVNSG
jgi:hypothetical protein